MTGLPTLFGATPARHARLLCAALACVVLLIPAGEATAADEAGPTTRHRGWDDEALAIARALPVQDDGRIKPFDTYATYLLLGLRGKKTVPVDGRTLSATEWLLDVLFVPDVADRYPTFLVTDDGVLDAVGLATEQRPAGRRKRDWWSFAELQPILRPLLERAREYRAIPAERRSPVEDQVVSLDEQVVRYLAARGAFSFTHARVSLEGADAVAARHGKRTEIPVSDVLADWTTIKKHLPEPDAVSEGAPPEDPEAEAAVRVSVQAQGLLAAWFPRYVVVDANTRREELKLVPLGGPAVFPPAEPRTGEREAPQWLVPLDVLSVTMEAGSAAPDTLAQMRALEAVGAARDRPSEATAGLRSFRDLVVARAESRGEYGKVGLEVLYLRVDPMGRGLWLFLGAFLLTALGWLLPRQGWLTRLGWWTAVVGAFLLVAGIVIRCVIRSKPPIGNLYEVILFVTSTGVLIALFGLGRLTRLPIALPLASVWGAVGMFVAGGYERLNGQDTMRPLEAVLDTNFWLSTHVTTVSMGYTAGFVASLIAHVYVLGKALGFKAADEGFYRAVARAVYGVVCFGLLFSVIGTILGGIWANDSWGRFWGWDPKENGALTICLWELAILHARMGGYIRQFGLCMAAVFGGTIVAWSMWGVNNMGVGLHSYGFTQGIDTGLNIFYVSEAVVLLTGGVWWFLQRPKAASA